VAPAGRLPHSVYATADARLAEADARVAALYPGEAAGRQPVHTVYVPAHHFSACVVEEWGAQARAVLEQHGGGLAMDAAVAERVREKLRAEPIEDLRIDFEDGYGNRPDEDEDSAALTAGRTLAGLAAAGAAPPFTGIRFKSFEAATRHRGIRTLDLFLEGVLRDSGLPDGFVVTLPKVTAVEQVAVAAEVLAALERAHALPAGALRFEVQIETPQSILTPDGSVAVAAVLRAAQGRCTGLHYGTYDYSAALGVSAAHQSMDHPAADFAKAFMQVATAETGVRLSDGSTNRLPVGEAGDVHAAWAEHVRLVRRSLGNGFYQGWDLHPHQLPSRFAATYGFFRDGFPPAAQRLRDYAEQTGGGVLDEPATAQALARFLVRGLDCGAFDPAEVTEATTLRRADLDAYATRSSMDSAR
jgi:citrate lyase beta subunit